MWWEVDQTAAQPPTPDEKGELVTNCDRLAALKHSSSVPYVFTEHGAVMLASVLKSGRALTARLVRLE